MHYILIFRKEKEMFLLATYSYPKLIIFLFSPLFSFSRESNKCLILFNNIQFFILKTLLFLKNNLKKEKALQ